MTFHSARETNSTCAYRLQLHALCHAMYGMCTELFADSYKCNMYFTVVSRISSVPQLILVTWVVPFPFL